MKIRKGVIEQIIAHARNKAPIEACGYLAARDGVIVRVYELTNVDASSEHFSFDPGEQFSAVKDARAGGLEVAAVYHSHPASPARPSAEDIKLAFDPDQMYVIVSLAAGRDDVKAFWIKDQKVSGEDLEVVNDVGL